MSAPIEVIGDFAKGPVEDVSFIRLAKPDLALPESPRFIFGSFPAALSSQYFSLWGISSIGIFSIRNVQLAGEYLLRRGAVHFMSPELNIHEAHIELELARLSELSLERNFRPLSGQYALLGGPGISIYGHWLIEHLPKVALLNAAGYNIHRMKYLLPTSAPSYVHGWLSLLGIEADQIVLYDINSDVIEVDELILPTILHNGNRMSGLFKDSAAFLRGLISIKHDIHTSGYGTRIFVSRAEASQSRVLTNRAQIEQIAADAGFVIIHPEKMSLVEQVKLFSGARQIMGEYGSALHGTLFAPAGTTVCALRGPALHPAFIQSGMGTALGHPTGYVFGEAVSGDGSFEFRIDPSALQKCIDLAFRVCPL